MAHKEVSQQIKKNSLSRSTLLMTGATLFSRATGLLRTWAMAFALGNTLITSAYNVANNLPNVIYELVAGGLLFAAFIPVYLQEKEKFNQEKANRFGSNILNILIIFLGILSVLATIFADAIVSTQTFTVSSDSQVNEYAVFFFRIFAIQILFYGVGGTITSILNAHRVFFIPSVVPALNNVVVVISFIAYTVLQNVNPNLALIILAVGTSLGVIVQFSIQIPALIKCGFNWRFEIHIQDKPLKNAIKIALPTIIYIAGTMAAFTFRNAFSLQVTDKGPSMLAYAWTWFQLPHGVIAVSISRVFFTEMSISFAKNDIKNLKEYIYSGISKTLCFITPFAVLLMIFSDKLLGLFTIGAFTIEDTNMIKDILFVWAFCLPVYCLQMHLYNIYASIRKFYTFMIVATSLVVFQCLLYWFLTLVMRNSTLPSDTIFVALTAIPRADFIYYGLSSLILIIVLIKYFGNFGIFKILCSFIRVCTASLIGIHFIRALYNLNLISNVDIFTCILQLIVYGGLGTLGIILLCLLFRVPDYLEGYYKIKKLIIKTIKRKVN